MRITFLILFICFGSILKSQSDFSYFYNQGQEKFVSGNFNEAATAFSSALKNKNSAKNDYAIANAYKARSFCKMELGNFSAAISDISDAIKLKPEFSELYLARTIIHLRAKQYDESIKWANEGLLLKPEYEDLILMKVKAKISKKMYVEALNDADTLLKINPLNIEAWNMKGSALQRQKNYPGAAEAFSKTILIDPQNIAAFYDRGISYAHMKDFEKALVDINRGMEIDSSERWIGYNNIAYFVKFEQKDYQGAIELFDKAIKLNPTFAYAYCNRGYAKIQLNDLKGARKDITKSLELYSGNSYAYKTFAQLLLAEKKQQEACVKLKKAIDLGYTEEYDDEVITLMKENCK
ncbi:MAG: tetratricopeptide repeat protein [Bacteroidetes bacterium]|nr:tetratricopeptide repeat protein [Bacteroidota bacterium]